MMKKMITHKTLALAAISILSLALPAHRAAAETKAPLLAQARGTKAQAEKIALAQVANGKVQSAELENEHHALIWSFDIVRPDHAEITEGQINAKNGAVVDITTETPAAQAKEKAKDETAERH